MLKNHSDVSLIKTISENECTIMFHSSTKYIYNQLSQMLNVSCCSQEWENQDLVPAINK